MVRTLDYHAEDLGSNPTPDKLAKCEFFLRKGSKARPLTSIVQFVPARSRFVVVFVQSQCEGFAYVGGACVVNKRLEKVNSVAIIEDTGGFSGIIVAAHEVGHLLGAVHDGSPPPSYLGGPGAEKCRWEDGYIMSDLRHTERGFRWSPCSVQSFHHFLNGDTASCLHNPPHEDEALGRTLPGTLLSLDAQCRRDRGTSACFKDERVCAQLFCFDSASGYCVAYRPAAEGSTCGDGQHCLDGRCVAEHENIIPDYSQHTPSYARFNQQPVKYV
ncbi:hypothetical protein RP20_CCG016989 [Aedes albopictus]|nr:hypothetical protein RP20_CCG016989 [Aedes albopictus]